MASVTNLVPSNDRIFSATARPTRAPMGVPASGISLPMQYRITLGWLKSLRTMASTSASHHSGNRNA